jgi:hypothetical protein
VAQIGLRLVRESAPKTMYYHLLAKHCFDEALQYAAVHGLDPKVRCGTACPPSPHPSPWMLVCGHRGSVTLSLVSLQLVQTTRADALLHKVGRGEVPADALLDCLDAIDVWIQTAVRRARNHDHDHDVVLDCFVGAGPGLCRGPVPQR